MYATTSGSGKYKRIEIHESYITDKGKSSHRRVETIGNYDELIAKNPNIMEELKQKCKAEKKKAKEDQYITVEVGTEEITDETKAVKHLHIGHIIVQRLWDILKMDKFLDKNCTAKNKDSIKNALFYLVAHRCSNPSSIRSTVIDDDNWAGIPKIDDSVYYNLLEYLCESQTDFIAHLNKQFSKLTDRKLDNVCYDVTTYAFESTRWGELRMFGFSKDHKNNEVQVVMGLLIDSNGIPITYELFPGNTMDQNTLVKSIQKLKKTYKFKRITVVADRGMNGKDNLIFLKNNDYNFLISYTLKRSKREFRENILSSNEPWQDIIYDGDGCIKYCAKKLNTKVEAKVLMTKEELIAEKERRMKENIKGRCPKYKSVSVPAYLHVTYSAKRARKDKADRERLLDRLNNRLENPAKIKASIQKGTNQYLKLNIDEDSYSLDEAKILEAELFDGYYAVVTDREDITSEEAMKIYRYQWKIEESFRILKSDLNARPVFVYKDDRIKGHFLMCYLSLSLIRYLQYLMEENDMEVLSAARIMQAINDPLIIINESKTKDCVTPLRISNDFISTTRLLKMGYLRKNMTKKTFTRITNLKI